MPERQSRRPVGSTLKVSESLGTLHAEAAEPAPPLATRPDLVSPEARQSMYAPRFIDDVHHYVREHIRNADQKAIFFFGATAALLAVLHSLGASARWLKPLQAWDLLDTVTFIGMLTLALSALTSAWAVVPRLPGSRRGLLYFNAVAEYESQSEYARAVLGATAHVLWTEKAGHCHILSKVCRQKYRYLRVSLWFGLVGLVCAFGYFLFGTTSVAAPGG